MWEQRMWRKRWVREEILRNWRRIFGFTIDLLDRVGWQKYFPLPFSF
jgi:hypothetical protein